jgi:hypothetical protein
MSQSALEAAATACGFCAQTMDDLRLEGHNGTTVGIDVCSGCQAFWFDEHESLRLTPASTLKLFALISDHLSSGRPKLADEARCPRCRARLAATADRQRATPFRYWRCPRGHGRLMTYFDFLKQKDFIRPLTMNQINELREHLQFVNCSSCGAPIDVGLASACAQCGSPISMLDMQHAGTLVRELQRAAEPRAVDPALPLELARARRQTEALWEASGLRHEWWHEVGRSGLVETGLARVARWFRSWIAS